MARLVFVLAAQELVGELFHEKDKIKGAVRTDFILSAEIMTVGVYGLVAGIVKLDDAGLHLSRSGSAAV